MRDCSRVNVPPTRISLASARVAAIAWNTFKSTSMRLRAIVLPTWSNSGPRTGPSMSAAPDRQRHPASASGRVDAVHDHPGDCRRHEPSVTRSRLVASLTHATISAARRPFSTAVRDGGGAATR